MKRCPQCHTSMSEVSVAGVPIVGCSDCGGVWFDSDELGIVANSTATDLLALEDQFLPSAAVPRSPGPRLCPNCGANLFEFEFPHSPGARLDACSQCHGIWADNGELQELYSRITGTAVSEAGGAGRARTTGRQALGLLLSRPCPTCHAANAAAAIVCHACGAPLPRPGKTLCPNCDVPLEYITYRGVPLDFCERCTGVWLDPGELFALAEFTPEELRRVQDERKVVREGISALWNAHPSLLCPRCFVSLAAPEHPYGADVSLDACLCCKGLWVGAGNLPAISRYYDQTLGRRGAF